MTMFEGSMGIGNLARNVVLFISTAVFTLVSAAQMNSPAQRQVPTDIGSLEEQIAGQFNAARKSAGLKQLSFRRDIRIRMEACSVAVNGPDSIVDQTWTKRKYWYSTADPRSSNPELTQIALQPADRHSVGVGVWYVADAKHPDGTYWVVVYPENSAVHEAFWGHFYLTDDFEYQTVFYESWKEKLPNECRSIK
jgi:hypothetical protein